MRYYRCKCGKHQAWSSMGVADCGGCDECQTTLAEGPNGHRDIAPHEWREEWEIDKESGERWKERICLRCMKRERVESATTPTSPEDGGTQE